MAKTKYYSGVDWWLMSLIIFAMVAAWAATIGAGWVVSLPSGGVVILLLVLIFGCWYEIDGNNLVVYQFFMPHKFPISKIKEVKKTIGYLATAGMSSKRVSIKFTDRSVLKSYMPLEISPKDRDKFIAKLKELNPNIVVK